MRVTALDHLVLTVSDLDRAIAFYRDVLGMEPRPFAGGRWALHFGDWKINLHVVGQGFEPGARHPTPGSADLCFVTDVELERWRAHLDALGVPLEEGPVGRTGASGAVLSLYLRDPDGNLIEVCRYL